MSIMLIMIMKANIIICNNSEYRSVARNLLRGFRGGGVGRKHTWCAKFGSGFIFHEGAIFSGVLGSSKA